MAFDAKLLETKRKAAGKTQAALAKEVNRDKRTMSRWVSGENKPSEENLTALANALGCTPQEFDPSFTGEGEVAVHARVSIAAHNAYELMGLRYGVSQKDIMELAPVLFSIVAGHALRVPSEDDAQAARLGLIDARQGSPEAQDAWGIDDRASQNRKCFGLKGEYSRNLFYVAIQRLCHDIQENVNAEHLAKPAPEEAPTAVGFIPDLDKLVELTGGDNELAEALIKGHVRLSKCLADHKANEDQGAESFVRVLRKELSRADDLYNKEVSKNRDAGLVKLEAWRAFYANRYPELAREYDRIVKDHCHEDGWYPSYYDEGLKELCWKEPYREDRHINEDTLPEYQAKKTEFPKELHFAMSDPIYQRFKQLESHRRKAKAEFEEGGQ
ncbi:helix-turn-helix domain-containing protein [Meridianimarinicoccus aquatilis]|uniref:XRE family transcriptional regulator n=1 Tax=Meridianimarinicoccus aquatilis TaxID=2552766 RepID=A0A4R6AK17_9RHOB|nr:helix-turn-helix transcriptional regulator [Fluviibacterium aquatile]TDL84591.1 XRE family transcriptional regulator [Fluviibacterium aquatile]